MNLLHRLCILVVIIGPIGAVATFLFLRASGVEGSAAFLVAGFLYVLAAGAVIYGGVCLYTRPLEGRGGDTQPTTTEPK